MMWAVVTHSIKTKKTAAAKEAVNWLQPAYRTSVSPVKRTTTDNPKAIKVKRHFLLRKIIAPQQAQ